MRNVLADQSIAQHRNRLIEEVNDFLARAVAEGLLRPDLPNGWVSAVLPSLMLHAAEGLPDLSAAQAADLVVDTLLRGVGALHPKAA
jgi:hypothetical protein